MSQLGRACVVLLSALVWCSAVAINHEAINARHGNAEGNAVGIHSRSATSSTAGCFVLSFKEDVCKDGAGCGTCTSLLALSKKDFVPLQVPVVQAKPNMLKVQLPPGSDSISSCSTSGEGSQQQCSCTPSEQWLGLLDQLDDLLFLLKCGSRKVPVTPSSSTTCGTHSSLSANEKNPLNWSRDFCAALRDNGGLATDSDIDEFPPETDGPDPGQLPRGKGVGDLNYAGSGGHVLSRDRTAPRSRNDKTDTLSHSFALYNGPRKIGVAKCSVSGQFNEVTEAARYSETYHKWTCQFQQPDHSWKRNPVTGDFLQRERNGRPVMKDLGKPLSAKQYSVRMQKAGGSGDNWYTQHTTRASSPFIMMMARGFASLIGKTCAVSSSTFRIGIRARLGTGSRRGTYRIKYDILRAPSRPVYLWTDTGVYQLHFSYVPEFNRVENGAKDSGRTVDDVGRIEKCVGSGQNCYSTPTLKDWSRHYTMVWPKPKPPPPIEKDTFQGYSLDYCKAPPPATVHVDTKSSSLLETDLEDPNALEAGLAAHRSRHDNKETKDRVSLRFFHRGALVGRALCATHWHFTEVYTDYTAKVDWKCEFKKGLSRFGGTEAEIRGVTTTIRFNRRENYFWVKLDASAGSKLGSMFAKGLEPLVGKTCHTSGMSLKYRINFYIQPSGWRMIVSMGHVCLQSQAPFLWTNKGLYEVTLSGNNDQQPYCQPSEIKSHSDTHCYHSPLKVSSKPSDQSCWGIGSADTSVPFWSLH